MRSLWTVKGSYPVQWIISTRYSGYITRYSGAETLYNGFSTRYSVSDIPESTVIKGLRRSLFLFDLLMILN